MQISRLVISIAIIWIALLTVTIAYLLGRRSGNHLEKAQISPPVEMTPRPLPSQEPTSASIPQAVPPPRFDWKEVDSQTFELSTLKGKAFELPVNTDKFKVTIVAESAVFAGIFDSARVAEISEGKPLRTRDFEEAPCGQVGIVTATFVCSSTEVYSPGFAVYYVRDKRAEGTNLLALGELLRPLGAHGALERAAKPNKVSITFSIWTCVANCSGLDSSNR